MRFLAYLFVFVTVGFILGRVIPAGKPSVEIKWVPGSSF